MSNKTKSLDDRMKDYEKSQEIYLTRRIPVIIRIDGKAFHTFTKGMDKPFDLDLMAIMQKTTMELVKNVEGCNFGYTQSDEISLLLTDFQTIDTEAWFDYRKSKLESVAASMATAYFNRMFVSSFKTFSSSSDRTKYIDRIAFFDARAWSIPKDEVVNYFIWRQQDATRNSVQMLGRSLYSHKELNRKNNSDIQELCFQKGINWNDLATFKKRGTAVYKSSVKVNDVDRSKYIVDLDIPVFTKDRNYIQQWLISY
jgi:tRNA(His) 5'-end guanylyltransferase